MQKVFITVLDMSIAAGYCAVFVMFARLFMKKLPKSYSYILWVLVFVRLLLPVVPESSWSLLPKVQILGVSQRIEAWMDEEEGAKGQAGVGQDSINQAGTNAGAGQPGISNGQNAGIGAVGNTTLGEIGLGVGTGLLENENESAFLPGNGETANGWLTLLSRVWLMGSVLLVGYGLTANVLLEKRLQGAKEMENGAYEIENLPTAFVTGLLNPRIYLPAGLSEEYRRYVLEHEKTHLKRGDVWVKYIAYMLTSIHWFNPLVWISYVLMCRDMEMSCDERVLQNMGMEEKKAYSTALLAVASGRKIQFGIPVAFGEQGAKGRIVNVLHYRKPAFWVTAAAGVVLVMLAVGLLSDPREEQVEVITPQFDETFLQQVEAWIDVAAPSNAMGFSNWFEEYAGDRWFEDYTGNEPPMFIEYNDSQIVFYPRGKADISEMLKKMLGVTTTVPFVELEKYKNPMWVAEYNEEAYLLMQWKGICRLQKFEDMMQYKHKKVELKDIPIYSEDLNDQAVLSEKLSQGVNIVYLFRDYTHVNEMNPVEDAQLVFDNIRYQNTDNIIHHDAGDFIHRYFDEEVFLEIMARKAGQDIIEFLNGRNLETSWYQRVYKGWPGDSMRMEIEVTEVKWLDDSQVEVYYSGTYYNGVAVMKEHNQEMVFVSHRRIYEEERVEETEASGSTEEHELLWLEENWQTFMEQNPSLKGIEDWLEDAASPVAYGGVASWFEEYDGQQFSLRYQDRTARSAGVVFYLGDGETLEEIMAKLLESLYLSKIVHVPGTLDGEVSYSRYLEEKAHHVGEVWMIEYLDDYYVMMEWQGVYRLQRLKAIMEYKEKEIQFEYEPLYAEDFSNTKILSEKLSKAVNLLLLYRDYVEASAFHPKENYEDMFDFVERGWFEEGIINYYLDETKYYEAMAQKTGQSMAEMLATNNIELTSYNKLYRAVRGDAIYAQARVNEVKWLNDTQAEVHYAFGWFEDGFDTHYFDGVSVWEEYDGEMIFVSNRRIYD